MITWHARTYNLRISPEHAGALMLRGHGSFSPVSAFQSRNLSSTTGGNVGAAACAMLSSSFSPSATRSLSSPQHAWSSILPETPNWRPL